MRSGFIRNCWSRTDLGRSRRDGLVSPDAWHNLGCAYSYLFQMEKAMECFWNAYSRSGTENEKALKGISAGIPEHPQ